MPGFDGTGPTGAGPMTGGSHGFCNPAGAGYRLAFGRSVGYGRGPGRGLGGGYGRGRAYGRGRNWQDPYPAPYAMDPSQEMDMLRAEADSMKRSLDEINRRIGELEKDK